MTTMDRLEAGQEIVAAKDARSITWQHLADTIGMSKVWTTAALLGQHPVSADQAKKVGEVLELDDEVVCALARPPMRGEGVMDPTDPVAYRFQEAVQVYTPALLELIREEFGDGIMSAIDFSMDFEREEDPKGDRVKLTWSGKFLPYRTW